MFATQTSNKKKAHGEPRRGTADSAQDEKAAREHNPVWRSLALNQTGIQRKLSVSKPDDPYEREADRIADRVMHMPSSLANDSKLSFSSVASLKAQRRCAPCEDEEENLQRKEQGSHVDDTEVAPSIVHEALNSPGQPLDPSTRSFMEPRFGNDFSQVRVYTDRRAAESASANNARAFTVGRDIVFGTDQYAPGTQGGDRLLAHELAHVVQQSDGSRRVQRQQGGTGQQPQQQQPVEPPNLMKIYSFGPTGAGRVERASGTTIFPPPAPVDANGNELVRAGTTAQPVLSRFGRYFTLDERGRALTPPVSDSRIVVETVWNADDRSESWRRVQEGIATYYGPGEPMGSSLGSEYIFRNDRPGVLSLFYVLVNTSLPSSAATIFLGLSHRVHYVNDPAAPPGATVVPDQGPAGPSSG